MSKSGSPYSFLPSYSSSTNHITAVGSVTATYDANGNVTNDGVHTYSWDADGNSITLDGTGLTFDALDRAVEKNVSGTYTEIVYSPTGAKLALMSGQMLQKAFVSLPGKATAVYTSTGLDHYRHSDWLGSVRLTSSPSRAVLSTTAYAPFGESYAQSGTADLSFTGQNSDTVGGDYDFLYREYSTQGRWPSPDPAGLAAVNPLNPQSWNRYAYVLNDPLGNVDPLGLTCLNGNGDSESGVDTRKKCDKAGGVWIDNLPGDSARASAGLPPPIDTFFYPLPAFVNYSGGGNTSAGISVNPMKAPNLAHAACVAGFTAAGAIAGGSVGGPIGTGVGAVVGGGVGTLAAPGPGTAGGVLLGGSGGGTAGTLLGAAAGGALGYVVGNIVCSTEQSQIKATARRFGIDWRVLGDAIEEYKRSNGIPGNVNLPQRVLDQIAREIAGGGHY